MYDVVKKKYIIIKLSISRQAEREYMVSSSIYHGIHYKESQEQCQWELLNEFGKKTARKVTSQCKITGCWVLVVFTMGVEIQSDTN